MMTREEFEKKFCKGNTLLEETYQFSDIFLDDLMEQIAYIDKYVNDVYIQIDAPNDIELVVNGHDQFYLSNYEDFESYLEVFYLGFKQAIESNARVSMDLEDSFSFWKRGSKKRRHAVEAMNSVKLQNEVVNRTGFGRKYEAGEIIDELPNAEGEFGRAKTNPIPVNASYGEESYLSRLRLKETGQPITFHRLGSCGTNHVCKNCVDCYEVMSLDGSFRDELFFDMYHDGSSTKAPEGYILLDESEYLTGVPSTVKSFPNGINNAVSHYSKKVLGSDISLPGLRKIDGENDSVVKYTIGDSENSEELEPGNLADLLDRVCKDGNKITAEEILEALQTHDISPEELDDTINKFSESGGEVSFDGDDSDED